MRRLFVLCAMIALTNLSVGCKVKTGVCDCGQSPGESVSITAHRPNLVAQPNVVAPQMQYQTGEPIPLVK